MFAAISAVGSQIGLHERVVRRDVFECLNTILRETMVSKFFWNVAGILAILHRISIANRCPLAKN